jgi:hypothetical protein
MGTFIMKINSSQRQRLIKEVQKEFGNTWPYLKIDYGQRMGKGPEPGGENSLNGIGVNGRESGDAQQSGDNPEKEMIRSAAKELLWHDFALTGETLVSELEILLQYEFGLPLQIYRKSGNLWLETRMTRHWTIRQQNEQGAEIATGY